jgi:YVTN family beta-propeller protein
LSLVPLLTIGLHTWRSTNPLLGVYHVTADPTGAAVYVANETSVSVIDTARRRVVSVIPTPGRVIRILADPKGSRVYVASDKPTLAIIDVVRRRVVTSLDDASGDVGALAVHPSGNPVYTGRDGLTLADTGTNPTLREARRLRLTCACLAAVHPSGDRLYVADYRGKILVLDTTSFTQVAEVSIDALPLAMTVSPSGAQVYLSAWRDRKPHVVVVDAVHNRVAAAVRFGDAGQPGGGIAVNPSGTRVYVASPHAGTISVIDTLANRIATAVQVGPGVQNVAIDTAGARLYAVNPVSSTVSIVDINTNAVIARIRR